MRVAAQSVHHHFIALALSMVVTVLSGCATVNIQNARFDVAPLASAQTTATVQPLNIRFDIDPEPRLAAGETLVPRESFVPQLDALLAQRLAKESIEGLAQAELVVTRADVSAALSISSAEELTKLIKLSPDALAKEVPRSGAVVFTSYFEVTVNGNVYSATNARSTGRVESGERATLAVKTALDDLVQQIKQGKNSWMHTLDAPATPASP
jgi:hypothetical protein